jgi:hypothetical protein
MTTEEFRKRAADCLGWAQEAANERTKTLWLSMAQIWFNRAEDAQRVAKQALSSTSDPTKLVRQ